MNIILTVILGAIVGWLGSIVMKTNAQMGTIANIVVGIIGSLIGFGVASRLGIAADEHHRAAPDRRGRRDRSHRHSQAPQDLK